MEREREEKEGSTELLPGRAKLSGREGILTQPLQKATVRVH